MLLGPRMPKNSPCAITEVEVVYGCKFAELFYGGMCLDRYQKIARFYHSLCVMPPFVLKFFWVDPGSRAGYFILNIVSADPG